MARRSSCKEIYAIKNYFKLLKYSKEIKIFEKQYASEKLAFYLKQNEDKAELYYDILPSQFQKNYCKKTDILEQQIKEFLKFLKRTIQKGNMAYMFWKENIPMNETEIQEVLENIMDFYFYKKEIDMNREPWMGRGKIDFKLYKNQYEKMIIEVKKAKYPKLKAGYEKQLAEYMRSCECKFAVYLIVCFNDQEYKIANKFMKEHKEKNFCHKNMDIHILDVRIDKKQFKAKNTFKMNKRIGEETDLYFRHIRTISEITSLPEIYQYFIQLRDNFHKLKYSNLKTQYLEKIQEIAELNKDSDFKFQMNKLFEKDNFYRIIAGEKSLQTLGLSFLNNLYVEKTFDFDINQIIHFFESMTEKKPTERINEIEIKEIFAFIKKKHNKVYQLLTQTSLDIYLVNTSSSQSNCECIPTNKKTQFSLICYYIKDVTEYQNHIIHSIYLFFFQLGLTFFMRTLENYNYYLEDFFSHFQMNQESCMRNFDEASQIFADYFTLYMLNGTTYTKYVLSKNSLPEVAYTFANQYFENFINKMLEKEKK